MGTEKLLEQIAKAPDDAASYLVYADAISAENDPQGELIVLMHQLSEKLGDPHLGSALDAHLTKHKTKFFGSLARHAGITWDFHLGFLRSVRYMPDTSDAEGEVVREILSLPIARVLRDLLVFVEYEHDIKEVEAAAEKSKPKTLPGLRFAKRHTTVESALADGPNGSHALWLELHNFDGNRVPREVLKLENLEWLDLTFASNLTAITTDIAKLHRLRRLEINWCYSLASIPDELFGIETLAYIQMYDCKALGPAYHMGRVNNLLGGFVRSKATSERRVFDAGLMFGHLDRLLAAGKKNPKRLMSHLLAALDNNVANVREEALRGLGQVVPNPFDKGKSIPDGASFALAGSTNFDKKQLATRLAAHGATLKSKIEPGTQFVIVGDEPRGKQAAIGDRPIVLETHLIPLISALAPKAKLAKLAKAVAAKKKAAIAVSAAATEKADSASLREWLSTRDEATNMRAMTAMKELGIPDGLLVDVLVASIDVSLKKSRDEAKKLLAIHAPPSLVKAVKTHLKSSLLLDSMGETKRAERMAAFCKDSKVIEPIDLAERLAIRARVSVKYLFENATSEKITGVLRRLTTKEGALDLHMLELERVPDEVAKLDDVVSLDVSQNHLHAWPDAVLKMKRLVRLDLSLNRVTKVPDAAAKMKLAWLDMGANRIRKFPKALLAMTTLEHLDLGNSQEYTENEARITGLPEEIRALTKLRVLGYAFNILDPFPEVLYGLKNLEELQLFQADLPKAIPNELSKLSKLRKMNIAYSTWAEKKAALKKLLPKCEFET